MSVIYSKYLKRFPASQYPVPLGGHAKVLIPGKLAVYDMAFLRVLFEFGNRCTAVVLDSHAGSEAPQEDPFLTPNQSAVGGQLATGSEKSGKNIVVFNPMPYGPEAQSFLRTLFTDIPESEDPSNHVNVKYLIAPDFEHHMGLNSWKQAYPNAKVLGAEGLGEKKKKDGITVDFEFSNALSNVLISENLMYGSTGPSSYLKHLPLPRELLAEFDFVYVPQHPNKEIVALHKPTKTLLTGDLIFNTPSHDQYSCCPGYAKFHPASGFSYLMRFFGIDSWLQSKVVGAALTKAAPGIQALYDWKPQTIIPAHGDIVTENSTEQLGKLFGKLVTKH